MQHIRKDERWTGASLGRCCGWRKIGIDFSAVLTLTSYWPSFLPSESTHQGIDWTPALLLNRARSSASFIVCVLVTVLIWLVPVGRSAFTCQMTALCSIMHGGYFLSDASELFNGGVQALSAVSGQCAHGRECQFDMWVSVVCCVFQITDDAPGGLCGDYGIFQNLFITFYWKYIKKPLAAPLVWASGCWPTDQITKRYFWL